MLTIKYHTSFKKDYKKICKRGLNVKKLERVIDMLAHEMQLPEEYHDHKLMGNYSGFRECHIEPDWLLIYAVYENELVLVLSRTGTHSDLFQK